MNDVKNAPSELRQKGKKINYFRIDVETLVRSTSQVILATTMNRNDLDEFLEKDNGAYSMAEQSCRFGQTPPDCFQGWDTEMSEYSFVVSEDEVSLEEYEEDGFWVEPDRPRRQKLLLDKRNSGSVEYGWDVYEPDFFTQEVA